jgi:hypothetical protein
MKSLLLVLCLLSPAARPVGARASTLGLPPAVDSLLPSYEKAMENYHRRAEEAKELEEAALPRVESVRELKTRPQGWLRDWLLRRRLGQLQECLDQLSLARSALGEARQDLFLQLSALEEELRSGLEKEMARPGASREKLRAWLEAKRGWDRKLEELGSSEAKPFDLVEVPRQAPTLQIEADQKKALEARGIQLEAWADMLASDLRFWKKVAAGNFVPKKDAQARITELEGLSRRVAGLIRKNEAQRLANRPQKK